MPDTDIQARSAAGTTLVVDLAALLPRRDLKAEYLCAAVSRDWTRLFGLVRRPRAAAPTTLAELVEDGELSVPDLPFDRRVVEFVRTRRMSGTRTALLAGEDRAFAERLAAHLGLFDEIVASPGAAGVQAAPGFLAERYGEDGYTYLGAGARSDLPPRQAPGLATHVQALRPHQWLKNLLVFLPMLAAHQLTAAAFAQSLAVFVAFCLVASAIYLLNDMLDLGADRAHPRKRLRALASGALSIPRAAATMVLLLVAGLVQSALIGPDMLLVMLAYIALSGAYCLGLKRLAVVDVCVLSVLYTARIVAGGAATDIALSVWLLAFSIFIFFALAAIKRQSELSDGIGRGVTSASGRGYEAGDLPLVGQMAVAAGYVSVLILALYLNSPAVRELYSHPSMLWGICILLLFWLSRMAILAHRGKMHDDPVVFAFRDPTSLVCGMLVAVFALAGALT